MRGVENEENEKEDDRKVGIQKKGSKNCVKFTYEKKHTRINRR